MTTRTTPYPRLGEPSLTEEDARFRLYLAKKRFEIVIMRDAITPWARPVADWLERLLRWMKP